ncbi:hypothetical protein J6590_052499 [Homalodisca vitripennis]|nr:hypothetical protein J6590_052499 [Homalodisca vitripennis]
MRREAVILGQGRTDSRGHRLPYLRDTAEDRLTLIIPLIKYKAVWHFVEASVAHNTEFLYVFLQYRNPASGPEPEEVLVFLSQRTNRQKHAHFVPMMFVRLRPVLMLSSSEGIHC